MFSFYKAGSEDDENVKREEFSDKSMETPVTVSAMISILEGLKFIWR